MKPDADLLLNRLESRSLSYFLAACQFRNLNVAAQSMGVVKSVLSEACTQVESILGMTLFQRDAQGIHPNQRGQHIAQYVLYLQNLEQFAHRVAGLTEAQIGFVSLKLPFKVNGLAIHEFLNHTLAQCAQQHPHILVWPENLSQPHFEEDEPQIAAAWSAREAKWRPMLPELGQCHLRLFVDSAEAGFATLMEEPWYALAPHARKNQVALEIHQALDMEDLRHKKVLLPRMPWALLQPISQWCIQHQIEFEYLPSEIADCQPETLATDAILLCNGFMLSNQIKEDWGVAALMASPNAVLAVKMTGSHAMLTCLKDALQQTWHQRQHLPSTCWQPKTSLKQWRYFEATLTHGSLLQAAQALYLSQPALSTQLKNFEHALAGHRLLDRQTGVRRLQITATGRVMQQIGIGLLDVLHTMGQYSQRERLHQSERLLLGLLPSVDEQSRMLQIIEQVSSWLSAHPQVHLEVVEEKHPLLMHALRTQSLNLAITEAESAWVRQIPLGDPEPMGLVIHARLLPQAVSQMDWSALSDFPLVLPRRGSGLRTLIDAHCLKLGISLLPEVESDSLNINRAWIAQGRYAGILPRSAVAGWMAQHPLQFIPLQPALQRVLRIAYLAHRQFSTAELSLIRHLVQSSQQAASSGHLNRTK